ncbi:MAG TPA: polysaccharide deacetylase family protein [Verrucomicrobiae bacterium]|nr:polysaccharide deacetylase family protein [Verrucomicrobiae bacterium]
MRALAFSFAGIVLLGALGYFGYESAESPGSQLFGPTVVRGPAADRVVALTYDDGPNPPYTNEIVNLLHAEGVHATFFVVGRAVAAFPAAVRQEVADGDALGNHTWDHAHLVLYDGKRLRETLARTDAAIYAATGRHSHIMRPPYGGRDWLVLDEVRRLGYTPVMWSVPLPDDWEYPPAKVIAARVLRYVTNGAIIDLHDGNQGILCARMHLAEHVCDRSADVRATKLIVDRLKREGYRFVTIPELLALEARATRRVSRAGE